MSSYGMYEQHVVYNASNHNVAVNVTYNIPSYPLMCHSNDGMY